MGRYVSIKKFFVLFFICLSLGMSGVMIFANCSYAELYKVNVTRKSSNVYKVDGEKIFLHTRYCYEYVYSEEAFLEVNGYSGEITFKDSKETCDVKAAYAKVSQSAGRYAVRVSRDEDDWYEIFGSNMYIKTDYCYEYVYGEEAILEISGYASGTLFIGSNQCRVEGIYSKLQF